MVYNSNYRFSDLFDFKTSRYYKLAMDMGAFAFMDWCAFCYLLYFICCFSLDVSIQDDDREKSLFRLIVMFIIKNRHCEFKTDN